MPNSVLLYLCEKRETEYCKIIKKFNKIYKSLTTTTTTTSSTFTTTTTSSTPTTPMMNYPSFMDNFI